MTLEHQTGHIVMPPTILKGEICIAFVHPPVCRLSVACIANNSRTQRPRMPKFGRKVPRLRCDSHTSFKVKRSKVRVGGGLSQPDAPLIFLFHFLRDCIVPRQTKSFYILFDTIPPCFFGRLFGLVHSTSSVARHLIHKTHILGCQSCHIKLRQMRGCTFAASCVTS